MTRRHDIDVEDRLAAAGHKLTAQRMIILDSLRSQRSTVTAQELFEALRAKHPSLGRATVFRNLDALVEVGLARRFERPGHVYAYASCSAAHHHHLICSSCHTATEIDEEMVASLVTNVEARYGFGVEHEALDFYGVCATCRERR